MLRPARRLSVPAQPAATGRAQLRHAEQAAFRAPTEFQPVWAKRVLFSRTLAFSSLLWPAFPWRLISSSLISVSPLAEAFLSALGLGSLSQAASLIWFSVSVMVMVF